MELISVLHDNHLLAWSIVVHVLPTWSNQISIFFDIVFRSHHPFFKDTVWTSCALIKLYILLSRMVLYNNTKNLYRIIYKFTRMCKNISFSIKNYIYCENQSKFTYPRPIVLNHQAWNKHTDGYFVSLCSMIFIYNI